MEEYVTQAKFLEFMSAAAESENDHAQLFDAMMAVLNPLMDGKEVLEDKKVALRALYMKWLLMRTDQ